jgi:glycosyltransferase involved in cell wall biosynthesis
VRVMFLAASGQIGGAERVLLDCIRIGDGWPGAEVSVVALGPGPVVSAADALGARTRVVEPPAAFSAVGDAFGSTGTVVRSLLPMLGGFPGFFRRFSRTIRGLVPDLIHSHGIKTHVLAALLPRRAPVVWHLHDYLGMRPLSSKLLRLLAHRCALAIAVSESVARDARRHLPAGLAVRVVHNSTDGERFCPDGPVLDLDSLAELPAAPAGTIRIGLPATFARWKGQDTFLKAIALVGRADVRAYVIGAPVYETRNSQWSRPELGVMARELGLEGKVGFTGFVSDMPAAYRALDIVVHASTRPEPFGLAIAEAMACARAVVAAPAGGAGELFVHEEHALAAASGDADALASSLRTLIDDPQKRAALGRRARAHVIASFGPERFTANLRAALSHVPGLAAGAAR